MAALSHASIPVDVESPQSASRTVAGVESQHSPTQDTARKENPSDPNLVDWDGDEDPEKPINWSAKKSGQMEVFSQQ
jgi:hypothetical protein